MRPFAPPSRRPSAEQTGRIRSRAVTRTSGLLEEGLEPGTNMSAVFKTGGKQYRVAAEDVLKVGKDTGEPRDRVEFGEGWDVDADGGKLGAPPVAVATSPAEVT